MEMGHFLDNKIIFKYLLEKDIDPFYRPTLHQAFE